MWPTSGNYVRRQVERWSRQYRASVTHPIPSMEHLMEWLPQQSPSSDKTTVVHGDFRQVSSAIDQLPFNWLSLLCFVSEWQLVLVSACMWNGYLSLNSVVGMCQYVSGISIWLWRNQSSEVCGIMLLWLAWVSACWWNGNQTVGGMLACWWNVISLFVEWVSDCWWNGYQPIGVMGMSVNGTCWSSLVCGLHCYE